MTAEELARAVGERLLAADAKVNALLGIELVSIAPGRAECRLTVRDKLVNSHDICHGGIVFALADTALAYASCSTNRTGVTQAASITYTRPARRGDTITASAHVESDGRRATAATVRVTNQTGQLVALVQAVSLRLEDAIVPG